MSPEETNEKPGIVSDDDWKQHVKAEDAALDEKIKQDKQLESATPTADEQPQQQAEAASSGEAPQMPPASLLSMISMFSTQAMVSLGMIPNPTTNNPEVQLDLARHFIDLLSVLEEKTKGNLDQNEEAFLHNSLHELRMTFVELSKNPPVSTD